MLSSSGSTDALSGEQNCCCFRGATVTPQTDGEQVTSVQLHPPPLLMDRPRFCCASFQTWLLALSPWSPT